MSNIYITGIKDSVPGVGGTPGPLWAQNVEYSLDAIDKHDHTPGNGASIASASISIDGNLPFNDNNATSLRSTRYTDYISIGAFNKGPNDKSSIASIGGELYWLDPAGHNVAITKNGSVAGATGSIGGLSSPRSIDIGVLGVSDNMVFTANDGSDFPTAADVGTPLNVVVGEVIVCKAEPLGLSGDKVTIKAPSTLSTSYNLTLPSAPPASLQVMSINSSGQMGVSANVPGSVPIGAVIATFPNLPGAYNCTGGATADGSGFVQCNGQSITDVTSPMFIANGNLPFNVPNLNSNLSGDVFLRGSLSATGTISGSNTKDISHVHVNGDHYHTLDSNGHAQMSQNGSAQELRANRVSVSYSHSEGSSLGVSFGSGTASFGTPLGGRTAAMTSSPNTSSSLSSTQDFTPLSCSTIYCMRIK